MDIETKLKYLQWQTSYTHTRPYRIAQFGRKRKNNDQRKPHNLVFQEGDAVETIRDIRGTTGAEGNQIFTLEINGFVYSKYPPPLFTNPKNFGDPAHIQNIFLPECEAILRNEIEGVDRVFIFDWKIRKKKSAKEQRKRNDNLLSFARQVHIVLKSLQDTLLTKDEPGTSMLERIRNHLPEEAHHLLSGRVQMINMWRPINGPVEDQPLAVCDGRTVDTSRLVETDMTRGDYTGTMLYPLYEPGNIRQWYYLSRQGVEDVLLFKSFDSKTGSVKYTPHSSFTLPDTPDDVCPRISVEVIDPKSRHQGHNATGFLYRTIAMDQGCYQYTLLALIMGRQSVSPQLPREQYANESRRDGRSSGNVKQLAASTSPSIETEAGEGAERDRSERWKVESALGMSTTSMVAPSILYAIYHFALIFLCCLGVVSVPWTRSLDSHAMVMITAALCDTPGISVDKELTDKEELMDMLSGYVGGAEHYFPVGRLAVGVDATLR